MTYWSTVGSGGSWFAQTNGALAEQPTIAAANKRPRKPDVPMRRDEKQGPCRPGDRRGSPGDVGESLDITQDRAAFRHMQNCLFYKNATPDHVASKHVARPANATNLRVPCLAVP